MKRKIPRPPVAGFNGEECKIILEAIIELERKRDLNPIIIDRIKERLEKRIENDDKDPEVQVFLKSWKASQDRIRDVRQLSLPFMEDKVMESKKVRICRDCGIEVDYSGRCYGCGSLSWIEINKGE